MIKKHILIFISCFLLGLLVIPIRHVYSDEPSTAALNYLIKEALDNNPQIQAAYNNWKAAEYKVTQVKSLPDPMAKYTYFGENIETRVGPQEYKYGASLTVPFPGKLNLKGKAQAKQADIFKEKYEAEKREVIRKIKFIYYDIFWVNKAIQVTEEEKAILESLEKVAQRRYESNLTPQQDVIKAQVELSKLIDKLFLLKQNKESLKARMNSILNRPKDVELGRMETVEPTEFRYTVDQLQQIARESGQELLAASLDIERAEYEKSLAGLDYLPNFTLGLDYIEIGNGQTTAANDGQDAWMGTVAVNVPIWFNKLDAQVKEKQATLAATRSSYTDVKNNINYEIQDLYFKITTYRNIVLLYKTALIPQTEQAFEAAKTGYETDKVDFLNWLDAERVLLQTRLAYYKAIVDYMKSIAYLERVVGRDLG